MKDSKQIIDSIIGNPAEKENIHPNFRAQQKLRRVNFWLQEEKNEILKQLKSQKESNLKLRRKSKTTEKKRESAEKQYCDLKQKLQKEEKKKNLLERRLYSTSSRKRSNRAERGQASTHSAVAITGFSPVKNKQLAVQSVQTVDKMLHNMSTQVKFCDQRLEKQLDDAKKRIKLLQKTVYLQKKTILDFSSTPILMPSGYQTERLAGRIVKSSKHFN